MADRLDFRFRQKVTEAELDESNDKMEQADRDLAADVGINGIISGMVVTEAGTPNLTLDVSGPGKGYNAIGERIANASTQNVDVSQDENSSSTSVGAGNERWVIIEARFDRILSDPQLDGNGATVFFQRQETFAFKVIMGAEVAAPAGGGDKPPKSPNAMLLSEFVRTNGQTQIFNADLVTVRRDDFVFAAGSAVSVNPAGWANILNSPANVQAAFDEVDDALIDRDAVGEIKESLLPDADGAYNLAATAKRWASTFTDALDVTDEAVIGGTVNMIAGGGNIAGPGSVGTVANPAANVNSAVFNSTNGTLAGAYKMNAAKSLSRFATMALGQLNTSGTNNWQFAAGQWNNATPGAHIIYLPVLVPHGVTLQGFNIRWSQVSDTAVDMTAQFVKVGIAGAETAVGSALIISTFASVHDATIGGALAEVIDRSVNAYWVRVTSSDVSGGSNVLVSLRADYDITDVGAASADGA